MINSLKSKTYNFLRYTQKYTGTDNVYLAKGLGWLGMGRVISSVLSFALAIAFANLLPKETYGTYKYLLSVAGFLGFLTISGFGTAVTRAVARGYEWALRYAFQTQLRWSFIPIFGTLSLSAYYFFKGDNTFAVSIFILGTSLALNSALSSYNPFLTGKKAFKRSSVYTVLLSSTHVLALLITLLITKNILVLISVYAIAGLIPRVFFYVHTLKSFKPRDNSEKGQERELFKYSIHLSLANLLSPIASHIDKIILFQFLGPAQLAVYVFALVIPDQIRGYLKNIINVALPKLSNKTPGDIKPVFFKRIAQGMAIGVAISISYILIAPYIFKLFLPQYLNSIIYSQILALTFIFVIPLTYTSSVFRSQKMTRAIYLNSWTANISRIILFVALGSLLGIWGIIFASLIGYTVSLIYASILWMREIKTKS